MYVHYPLVVFLSISDYARREGILKLRSIAWMVRIVKHTTRTISTGVEGGLQIRLDAWHVENSRKREEKRGK